jgi:hypothetical protein
MKIIIIALTKWVRFEGRGNAPRQMSSTQSIGSDSTCERCGGDGTRMVFPGHHRRRAANEGYEICVGAASHMPGGQAQPCLL